MNRVLTQKGTEMIKREPTADDVVDIAPPVPDLNEPWKLDPGALEFFEDYAEWQERATDAGYAVGPDNSIDYEIGRSGVCDQDGAHMLYAAWRNGGRYRAVAYCPRCGRGTEF